MHSAYTLSGVEVHQPQQVGVVGERPQVELDGVLHGEGWLGSRMLSESRRRSVGPAGHDPLVVALLDGSIVVAQHDEVPDLLGDAVLIERFAYPTTIVHRCSPLNHNLQVAVAQDRSALRPIHQQAHPLLRVDVNDAEVRIHWIVVAAGRLELHQRPSRSVIDYTFLLLQSVRVSIEGIFVLKDSRRESRSRSRSDRRM